MLLLEYNTGNKNAPALFSQPGAWPMRTRSTDMGKHIQKRRTFHGHTKGEASPTYTCWATMRQRCGNPRNHKYPAYGGRGIRICQRWCEFKDFLADMGEKPASMTIDRIDNDGHYSCGKCAECLANGWPANCRWATSKTQQNNRNCNHRLVFGGTTYTLADFARLCGLKYDTVWRRVELGWSPEQIASTPPIANYLRRWQQ